MSRTSDHALSQVLVLNPAKAAAAEAQQSLGDLERELRVARDELARSVDEQLRLRVAAEAARRVSVAEAEARVDSDGARANADAARASAEAARVNADAARVNAENALAAALARITELQAALARDQGSLAFASIRFLRGVKDGVLVPPASLRRSLYDKALASLKRRLRLEPGR